MTDSPDPDAPSLFDLDAVLEDSPAGPWKPGRVELLLTAAIKAAVAAGRLIVEDAGLIGSALAGARALDVAERTAGKGGGPYATAALLTPYRETCNALRLPAPVEPDDSPRLPVPTNGQGDLSSLLGDAFGTAE